MPAPRELNTENRKFSFSAVPQFAMDGQGAAAKRKFSGVAYSGEVIPGHWYWGNVVFELGSMSVPAKLPALIDHDRGKRAGYVTDHTVSDTSGFLVTGNLLTNESGKAVAQDSDEGFPWQMSVHIEPGSIEEVGVGTNVTVNGRNLTGPLTVFRNSSITEVSFTATGWDSNTSAAAMSRGGEPSPSSQGDTAMDLKQLQDRVAALEAEKTSLQASNTQLSADLKTANEALTKFSADARTAAVQLLFSDIGREFKEDDSSVKQFSAMSQEAFDATAALMRDQFKKPAAPAAPTLPASLFSHAANGGAAGAPNATAPAVDNPLMADAQKRAQTFSKRAG